MHAAATTPEGIVCRLGPSLLSFPIAAVHHEFLLVYRPESRAVRPIDGPRNSEYRVIAMWSKLAHCYDDLS
jgi:hypothetical protein